MFPIVVYPKKATPRPIARSAMTDAVNARPRFAGAGLVEGVSSRAAGATAAGATAAGSRVLGSKTLGASAGRPRS
ncbi:MAG: hypothetical protein KF764_22105 [Labilithrix sp.]|nr:hypothetical protein [Labilithrix sp.]